MSPSTGLKAFSWGCFWCDLASICAFFVCALLMVPSQLLWNLLDGTLVVSSRGCSAAATATSAAACLVLTCFATLMRTVALLPVWLLFGTVRLLALLPLFSGLLLRGGVYVLLLLSLADLGKCMSLPVGVDGNGGTDERMVNWASACVAAACIIALVLLGLLGSAPIRYVPIRGSKKGVVTTSCECCVVPSFTPKPSADAVCGGCESGTNEKPAPPACAAPVSDQTVAPAPAPGGRDSSEAVGRPPASECPLLVDIEPHPSNVQLPPEDADEEWVEAEGGGFQRADAAASLNTRGDGDDDCPDLIDDASDDDCPDLIDDSSDDDCPSPPPSAPNSDDEADDTRYYSGDSEGFSSSNDAQAAKRRRGGRRPSDMPPTPPLRQPDGPSVQPQQTLPESMASAPARAPPSLSVDKLQELRGPGGEDAGLTEKQSAAADKYRQRCENELRDSGGADVHRFQLFRDGARWRVRCLVCGDDYTPTYADGPNDPEAKSFLKNFWNWHLMKGPHRDAAAALAASRSAAAADTSTSAAGPSTSSALPASSSTVDPSAMTTDLPSADQEPGHMEELAAWKLPPLSNTVLDKFAEQDAESLPEREKGIARRMRQKCQELLPGGARFSNFRILEPSPQGEGVARQTWRVACDCCDTITGAQSGKRFLDNFWNNHLSKPKHMAAATSAFARQLASARDAAAYAAAAAGDSASEAMRRSATAAVAALEEYHAAAAAAAERARRLVEEAREGVGHTPMPPCDVLLEDRLQPTNLETLVAKTPSLEWLTDTLTSMRDRIFCRCCRVSFAVSGEGYETEKRLCHNIGEHLNSKRHCEMIGFGGRTIDSMFGGFQRGPAPAPPEPPDKSKLCNGYHFKERLVGGRLLDLRPLLRLVRPDGTRWYGEPHYRRQVERSRGRSEEPETVDIEGTLRSVACEGYSTDASGMRLPHGMCLKCRAIERDKSFIKAAKLHCGEQGQDYSDKTNFRYLSPERLLELLRKATCKVRELKSALWLLTQKYTRKCKRVERLEARLRRYANHGDVKALVDDILEIENEGKWESSKTLLRFVKDLVHSYRLRDGAEGARSANMRWGKSSKRIFAVLRKYGGPRTLRFIRENLEAPNDRTIQREWAGDKMHFKPGAHADIFAHLGRLYALLKKKHGIDGPVMYELSEDETTVPGASQYNQRLDSIVGFCGKAGENHQCKQNCSILIQDSETAYEKIADAWATKQLAGHLRIMVVNPLHPKLPSLTVVAHATCNCFDAVWIRNDWDNTKALAEEHISPHLGQLIGRGSDGDARRFKNQLEDMQPPPKAPGRLGLLDAPGFTLSARIRGEGDNLKIDCIHSQDWRHNLAKLMSHIAKRVITFGRYVAAHSHLEQVLARALRTPSLLPRPRSQPTPSPLPPSLPPPR